MLTSWSCLREGIDVLVRRFPLLLGAWLVILAVQQLINLVIPPSWMWIGLLLQIVVLSPLYAGQFLLALRTVRSEPAAFRDLFHGIPCWGTLVVVSLLTSLLTGLGCVLLIIPGILWALMFSFAPIAVLDRSGDSGAAVRIGAIEAMKRSKELTEGYRGTLFGISLLLAIPSIVVATFVVISTYMPDFYLPYWAIELFSLLSGSLFLGPLHAASYMVAYDAITGLTKPSSSSTGDPAL